MPTVAQISVNFAQLSSFTAFTEPATDRSANPRLLSQFCLGSNYRNNPTYIDGFLKRTGDVSEGSLYLPLTLGDDNVFGASVAVHKMYVDTRVSSLSTTVESQYLKKSGGTMTGQLVLNTNTPTTELEAASKGYVDAAIPIGSILMWSGAINQIPVNWRLCDGQNGRPNLLDRFIVGAGSSYTVGLTGGLNTVTLTVGQIPAHTHEYNRITGSNKGTTKGGSDDQRYQKSGSEDPSTTSTGGGKPHENRPPYYALAYIIRVA